MLNLDKLILGFDNALRTIGADAVASRPFPDANIADDAVDPSVRKESAALMRVNHCGEVCAQALYQGQALSSKNQSIKESLEQAAREEEDHLAWCEKRIKELGGRTSVLNPLWYLGSLAIGVAAGKLGDGWNLGFLNETERQVERHLEGHLSQLDSRDLKSRAIVAKMKEEEAEHARTAQTLGARDLPAPVRAAMTMAAKVMTTISYRI